MSFKIDQIVNKYLKIAAQASDNNSDGIISNEESSIFLKKSDLLKREGLINAQDMAEIKDILSQDITLSTKTQASSQEAQKEQQKQNIEFDLLIHQSRLEKLKNSRPEGKTEKRTKIIEAVTATATGFTGLIGGTIAAAKIGTAIGSGGGPVGMAVGAIAGMIIGIGAGIYAGRKMGESLITEYELQQEQQTYDESILKEENTIKNLNEKLQKLQ